MADDENTNKDIQCDGEEVQEESNRSVSACDEMHVCFLSFLDFKQ